ncbi:MAG: SIMPL domain-containing protein [Candidatus Peribacteria bacterium]|jgi:uncharacterized protein YggE|nr:SIMPL domain-containing protein [Candidatus Peribacteria bacterium]
MKTGDRILIIIVAFLLCATIMVTANIAQDKEEMQGINVQGEAVAEVQPDTLTLHFSIQEKADTSLEAQTKIDEINKNFVTLMKELGVDANRIQTSNYSVYQNHYRDNVTYKQIPDGYHASQSITVTLDGEGFVELGQQVLSAAPTVGNININGTNFSLKDRSAGQAEVRALAVEAAYKKAQQLAKAAGVKLGKPILITENASGGDFYYSMYNMKTSMSMGEADMDDGYNSVGLSAGTNEVRVSVNITYEIK